MKILKVQIPNLIKNVILTTPLLLATSSCMVQNQPREDVFNKSAKNNDVDKNSFSPQVKIDGKVVFPTLVVDISDKTLYSYDSNGILSDEFPVRLCEKELVSGINSIEVTKHDYDYANSIPKIILSKIKRSNGRVIDKHKQVIVGSKGEKITDDNRIFTNVVLVDRDVARKITKKLTNDQFILIKK